MKKKKVTSNATLMIFILGFTKHYRNALSVWHLANTQLLSPWIQYSVYLLNLQLTKTLMSHKAWGKKSIKSNQQNKIKMRKAIVSKVKDPDPPAEKGSKSLVISLNRVQFFQGL